MVDCLFIAPPTSKEIYQGLALENYTPIEPPTWALLLAESCRSNGRSVAILDLNIEKFSHTLDFIKRVKDIDPKYVCFVVYGPNPNSGTMMMGEAIKFAGKIKVWTDIPTIFVGSHVSALPYESLKHKEIDIILTNEGVYALQNILLLGLDRREDINGIGFLKNNSPFLTPPERVVPQERMDLDLPGYAWDLLPYEKKPLDLYRSHFWHAEYDHSKRSPFAAIYTSLGCMFKCSFCMINILNRSDNNPIGVASDYAGMRFWSPKHMVDEIQKLSDMGVTRIRISDEMFLLNKKYYVPFCEEIARRGLGDRLNMWAYSRIDTVRDEEQLKLIRSAGIKWLCLGIESGDKNIRLEVTKGKFEDVDIRDVVRQCHENGIDIIANYMFGLPNDSYESMVKTLSLSLELCTVVWNAYAAMALPGSLLYKEAMDSGCKMPETYEGYSFHSYETQPLSTDKLSAKEILAFRDWAWRVYHTYPAFLDLIEKKYGITQRNNIEEMSKISLKRKLLGD